MENKRNEEIIRLRMQGETCGQIAERFGITDSRVSQICMAWQKSQSQVNGGATESSLFQLMTTRFSMTKSNGRTSHLPGATYATVLKYWESLHPGTIPTVDDLCAMTEEELRLVPNLGKGMRSYIRRIKQGVIKMNTQKQMKDLSVGAKLINAFRENELKEKALRTAVYIRIGEDDINSTASVELVRHEKREAVIRLTGQNPDEFYIDKGAGRTALAQLLAACRNGQYDLIYTKSVRRFGSTIAETEKIVEELKRLTPPVGVYFAECCRYTLNPESEEAWREFLDLIEDGVSI